MRTIIAGSRGIRDYYVVRNTIRASGFEITEVLCGTAQGVDLMGEEWACSNGIPVRRFPAAWGKHGKKAGILRNIEMACNADALIAIWDGKSKGTAHMMEAAAERGLMVYVHNMGAKA